MIRGDLSNRLVHLTRATSDSDAGEKFRSIISNGYLKGSDRDIRGGFKCVCFSEAPLSVLTHSLGLLADEKGMRYSAFGVLVSKKWLFDQGGRPVIYQTNDEYDMLHEQQKYRHVRYEPDREIDYTWEREWRIHTEKLELVSTETTFIVPTRDWEQHFIERHIQDVALQSFVVGVPVSPKMEWHFIVLEDLGVEGFDKFTKSSR